MVRPGPLNLITDVPSLSVGHATDERARTGVTALLCPGGWVAAADVRGGGPGEREVSALGLENLVGRAHAIVLAGGSVFGLGAGDGATAVLSQRGEGVKLAPDSPALPIVPTAILHDLGNGGDKVFGLDPPYRRMGMEAVEAARPGPFALGAVGAGRGARAGLLAGGIGSASCDLGGGIVVGTLVAANPLGSVLMGDSRTYWAWPFEIDGEFGGSRPGPDATAGEPFPQIARLQAAGRTEPGVNTTLAVVAVSASLSGPQCKRVAIMAHDGMARAVRPAHTPFDGDIAFVVAKGEVVVDEHRDVAHIGAAAADCVARAIARAVYESNRD